MPGAEIPRFRHSIPHPFRVRVTGHVSRAMLSRYSRVRTDAKRRALDEIAARQRAADENRQREADAEAKTRMSEIVLVDPDLMHGTPCFRGTRVPACLLLEDLKSGSTVDEFLAGCPTVTREQA